MKQPPRTLPLDGIKPRKKLENETEEYSLCRRLEEYMEFALATRRYSDLAFYEELLCHIEQRELNYVDT